ncbi:zinc finger protein 2 homolog [Pieris brassicae]|uniref:zinc finger protein 2 homolog n=1 Tax=Pieris brassicae TaxID=7116 RepID=UPI001E662599|nr:zinc finger protein 2 homolog [Pieris brassicae]
MSGLLVCRMCLASEDVKLCSLSKYKLVEAYEFVTGNQILDDMLPSYICMYCSALLRKLLSFKEMCLQSQELLKYFCNDLKDGKLQLTELKKLSASTVNQYTTIYTDYIINIEYTEPVIKEEVELKEEFEPKRKKKRKSPKVKELPFLKLEDDDFHDDFEEKNDCDDFNVEMVILTKQEQIAEIEARKVSVNYVNSLYQCDKCYKGFITEATYKNHMVRHDTSRGEHICDVCLCVWGEAKSLRSHMVTAHERKYICKLCNYVSRSTNRAREHSQWHNGRTFDCKTCGQSFSKSTSYLTHSRLQHPTNNSCDICGESFLGEYGLNLHKRKAHADSDEVINYNESCESCGVEFASKEAVKRHLEHSTNGECANLCSCVKCGESFETEELLDKHMKEHPEEGNTCLECNKKFANERSFSIHVERVHLGIKMKQTPKRVTRERRLCAARSCVCEICGKSCTNNTSLVAHQRIHSGEKPFHCSECPKKFSVYQRLQIHLRTHTGECPYPCTQCPKAFKHKAALNRHFRVHSGVKPYACSYCGKAFSQSNSMKMHVNTVHLKLPTPYRRKNRNTHPF